MTDTESVVRIRAEMLSLANQILQQKQYEDEHKRGLAPTTEQVIHEAEKLNKFIYGYK